MAQEGLTNFTFYVGDEWDLGKIEFRDPRTEKLIDPENVEVVYTDPDGEQIAATVNRLVTGIFEPESCELVKEGIWWAEIKSGVPNRVKPIFVNVYPVRRI